MKNPLKHLKHMWKDPINTIDEANARKKEVLPWLFASIGVAVLGAGLSNINGLDFLMFVGIIGIFGVMVFGFLLFVIRKAKQRFEALTCSHCGQMATFETAEKYAAHVSYTFDGDVAEYRGISHPSSTDGVVSKIEAKATAKATATIKMKCPVCGETKLLYYHLTPFKCSATDQKVLVRDVEIVKSRLESAVKEVVADYNNPEKKAAIPYSIHSKKNPNYENRGKLQVGSDWIPRYNNVKIDYRKDVTEMVDSFFLENQIDGTIEDPNKPKKSK